MGKTYVMRRRDSFEEVTNKDIEKIDDVTDAIDLCLNLDIPLDGLDSIEEFRERIKLHSEKKLTGNRKRKV